MYKKKLVAGLTFLAGAIIATSLIATQYVNNSHSNRYNMFRVLPSSASTSDLIQAYFVATVTGAKLEYLASFSHTSPLTQALDITKKTNSTLFNNLGKTGYILIDDQYGSPLFDDDNSGYISKTKPMHYWSTNVASIQFRADLGSFITGVTAGQFMNDYKDQFTLKNGKLTWSTYGANVYPSITSFMNGFTQGVNWFNENIAKKIDGYVELERIDKVYPFAESFDIGKGNEIITDMLNSNINLLFAVAGAQITDVVKLVKDYNKKTVVISVDTPGEENNSLNKPLPKDPNGLVGNGKIIQFSSVKNIDLIVSKITAGINDNSIFEKNINNPDWADIGGIGYSSLGNVDNDGVGVSLAGQPYFIKAMKSFAQLNDPTINIETYKDATKLLSLQPGFIIMNTDEAKLFEYSGKDGQPKTLSYQNIPNNGYEMLPITKTPNDRKIWYETIYAKDKNVLSKEKENLESIENWISKNKETIEIRKSTIKNLNGQFTASAYNKNPGLIKIIFQDPVSILFDNGYLQSCYGALINYWKSQEINLPPVPNVTK